MLKNQRKDTYQPRGRSLQLPPSCRFPPLREGNRARVRFPLLSGGTLRRGFSFIRTFVNSGSAIGIIYQGGVINCCFFVNSGTATATGVSSSLSILCAAADAPP